MKGLDEFIDSSMDRYIEQLVSLLTIRSVSNNNYDSYDPETLSSVVERTMGILTPMGFQPHVIRNDEAGPGLVATSVVDKDAPWLLIYNHLDVVPPGNRSKWETNPFEPVVTDEKIIGRGATDDKGPALVVLNAIDYLQRTGQLPINVAIAYETDEEMGSRGFGNILKYFKYQGIRPDSILVSDTEFEGDDPAIHYSLRGAILAKVSLQTKNDNVHSGLGSLAIDPTNILTAALASCYNYRTGRVIIPGISGKVRDKNVDERKRISRTYDLKGYLEGLGIRETYPFGSIDEALEQTWHAPTFKVGSIVGHEGTTIPNKATAKISMRLFGQDPDETLYVLRSYLKSLHPDIEVDVEVSMPSIEIPTDSLFFRKAEDAYKFGFGRNPVYVGVGGGIGAFSTMQEAYPGVPIVCMSLSKLTDGYHKENEQFEFAQAKRGIKTIAHYLANIGDLRTK